MSIIELILTINKTDIKKAKKKPYYKLIVINKISLLSFLKITKERNPSKLIVARRKQHHRQIEDGLNARRKQCYLGILTLFFTSFFSCQRLRCNDQGSNKQQHKYVRNQIIEGNYCIFPYIYNVSTSPVMVQNVLYLYIVRIINMYTTAQSHTFDVMLTLQV